MKKAMKLTFIIAICLGMVFMEACSVTQKVSEKEKLETFSATIGAQYNPTSGGFLDLTTGKVYSLDDASAHQKAIDVVYAYGRNSKMNFMSPKSARVKLFGGGKYKRLVSQAWDTRNRGYFVNIRHGEKAEKIFKSVNTRAKLIEAYHDAKIMVKEFPNYKRLRDGPTISIRHIKDGDIIVFKSSAKDLFAIGKVTDAKSGINGRITLDFKVAAR